MHGPYGDGVRVTFGDGTDEDTFQSVFGALAAGWNLAVNGTDYTIHDVSLDGITGYTYSEDDPDNDEGRPAVTIPWDDVEVIHVY